MHEIESPLTKMESKAAVFILTNYRAGQMFTIKGITKAITLTIKGITEAISNQESTIRFSVKLL